MTGELDLAQWISFDKMHPAPTFFARPAWALALCDASSTLRPAPLWAQIDGVRYIVPTVRARTRMPFREHLAFPMGGYTCVLDPTGAAADSTTAARVLKTMARSVDRLSIIPWPFAVPGKGSARQAAVFETAAIACSNGYDEAIGGVRGVTRRMAGQAQRRGVICERAPLTSIDAYYELLREASHGWGLAEPTISQTLMRAVATHGGDDAEVWFARVDGQIAGGGVVLFGARELFFWSAAMRRDFARHRPSNALNFALIARACERGVDWYNLGASEGLEGVARFKRDLGATTIVYPQLDYTRTSYALYHRARAQFATSRGA